MPYLGIFGLEFEIILSYFKSALLNFSSCKVCRKYEIPYIRNQTCLFGIFGREFEKIIVIFDALEFV